MNRTRKDQQIIAAIDIGASKISCFIARLTHEQGLSDRQGLAQQIEIIGVGHHGSPLKPKYTTSAEELEMGLRKAVDAAERMAEVRIHKVTIGVAGKFLRTRRIGVDLEITDGVVTQEDIEDSINEGARLSASPEYTALHALATAFKLDDEGVFDDPAGLNGSMLSTQMLGVSARLSVLDNLGMIVERCGLIPADYIAAPYAAAEATLIDDEKDLGVVLIDIGAASTAFSVYDNGVMIDCGGVGVGGGHITKDIAQIFGTPLAQAERIKTLYGAALIGPGDEHRFVDVPQMGDDAERIRTSRADLCDVIIPRVEEIFELVSARLPGDANRSIGLRRAVLTGGGSLLVGARESAEKILSMKCRLGRPLSVAGGPEAASAPGFAVCAGLLQCRIKARSEDNFALGLAGQSPHAFPQSAFFGGMEAWLRAKF
ncbi:MAG: cell division protein FtsA [Hyphococcus sp.]|nr:MAG: cell division protein FtsA [Marinicaulis sp.]